MKSLAQFGRGDLDKIVWVRMGELNEARILMLVSNILIKVGF